MIITATLSSGTPNLTNISNTSKIGVGNFIYGNGIPVETKVLSIDSISTLTMDKNASVTGSEVLTVSFSNVGQFHLERCSKKDALDTIIQLGDQVIFYPRGEAKVTRDRYQSIKKEQNTPKHFIPAYPIEFKPTRRVLEAMGLREDTDVAVTTAVSSWDLIGIDIDDIRTERATAILRGNKYKIEDLSFESQMGSSFLYMNFGLNKK